MRVLFITKTLSGNSLGRTYALWLCAQSLGWESLTVSVVGERIWGPLAGSIFAATCSRVSVADRESARDLDAAIEWCDVVVLVKPSESTLGLFASERARFTKPVVLDIDDPDLESALEKGRPIRALGKWIFRNTRMRRARARWKLAHQLPTMVSNPVLLREYGGVIVPHARVDVGDGVGHVGAVTNIAFVGTNNPHKGVGSLRQAVSALSARGYSLTITDQAPSDAKSWENWVGKTSIDEGINLVRESTIVALPSSARDRFARGQLPAKLMDAMLAGRAIIVSDLEPMAWAIGDSGIVVPPDDTDALESALLELHDPHRRAQLGAKARQRALGLFEVDAVAASFREAIDSAALNGGTLR